MVETADGEDSVRIAQVCPIWERVPPPAYGGIEAVVSELTEALVRRGHDVTLYASGDSQTTARLRSVCATSMREAGVTYSLPIELAHVSMLLAEADQYDLIHNHCGELVMAFSHLTTTPTLTSLHGTMVPESRVVWQRYRGWFNTISHAEKAGFPDDHYLGVVYNGIPVETFPFCDRSERADYLLFLGRISEEKGTHLAIEVAQLRQERLIIAGKVDRFDRTYYEQQIAPRIDGTLVSYVGEADGRRKRDLFAHARALLHPVTWPEPFGLVMAEAMACGTPVVGLRQGSVPELIEHGRTGWVCDDVNGMVAAIDRLAEIDPYACRERVRALFSTEQMVDGYERLYQRLVEGSGPRLNGTGHAPVGAAKPRAKRT
jgi:glycosyltransferase involved in cell wall biosynthesis